MTVVEPPRATDANMEVDVSVKYPTVSVTMVEGDGVMPEFEPTTVIAKVPGLAAFEAARVIAVPLKLADTPKGRALVENAMAPPNPPCAFTTSCT